MTESEDDDCPGPSQQKRKLEEEQHLNKEKTITAKKSKDAALKNIMAKKINERSNSSSFASSMSTSKTTKTAVVKKTNTTTTTPVIPSNSSCANCKIQSSKLKKLTEKNESLEEEVARLSELNRRLQVEVLDKFNTVTGISTATTGRTSQTGQTPGISAADDPARKDSEVKYMAQDGQVSLGEGIKIPKEKFDTIASETRNSLVVKNMAVAIWGTETLRNRSVTGKASNRFKERQPLPALEPAKVKALKDFFEYHLGKQPLQPAEKHKEMKEFSRYLREKIQDLKPKKLAPTVAEDQ
ncbi:BEN domain-containing protein 5-like [Lytechinus pictus]|uniref:BEN domain-containing protein 5-like n=1 Tax=Lytechinus pictus TaxID=7653 RepID=UPI0030B9D08E